MSRRWRRILIGFCIAVVVTGVYAWFFGFQTMMILETRRMARQSPFINQTPRSLTDVSISTAAGKTVSYFGYTFEVPWDDLDASKTKTIGNHLVLAFHSDRAILFSSSPPGAFAKEISENFDKNGFRRRYGDRPLPSDYEVNRVIWEATPKKMTLFAARQDVANVSILLMFKAIMVPEESGLYSIENDGFKGFQFGDPEARPRHVVVDLFAADASLEFIFVGRGISQAEINLVVQSVHKMKDAQPGHKLAAASGTPSFEHR